MAGINPPEPQIVGVNQLQQTIDQFNQAVNRLTQTADKFSQTFQGGQSSYGHYTASPQQQAGPPSPSGGGFAQALPGMGLGPPRTAGQPAASPVGNVPPPVPPPPGQRPPPGNGGYAQSPFGPPRGLAKVAGFHIPYTKGSKAAAFLGAAAAVSGMGEDQFKTQVNMSSFVQQQQLMAPGNFTGQSFAQAARFQAYGGRNRNLNSVAFNAQDASAGQFTLSQLAGQSATRNGGYSMPIGRAGQAAANMFGYANPGLGYSGGANMAAQMYNPQTSLRMMQLGYQQTPLNPQGGVARQPGQVVSSMIKQMFHTGKNGITPQSLAFQLRSGSVGQIALEQAIGSNDPQTVAAWTSTMETINRLTTGAGGQKKLSSGRAQSLISQASRGDTSAQNMLNSYGVNRSDLQNIKNANAARTGTSADIADSFNKGLEAATSSLEGFRKMLDSLARTPFGQAGATAGGFAGTMASIANPGGMMGVAGSIAQIAMLKKLSTAMKAGGATSATGALLGRGATSAGRIGALGGIVDSVLPFAASAAFLYGTNKIKVPGTHGKSIWGLGSHQPGQPHGMFGQKAGTPGANPMNSWGQLFHDLGSVISSPFRHLLDKPSGSNAGLLAKVGPAQAAPGGGHSSGNKFKGGKGKHPKTGISAAAVTAVADAKKELGVPYVFGGETPGVGFDCSGLVQWAYGQAGVALPRTSQDQYAATKGRAIDPSKAQAGDLVFQGGSDGSTNNPGHVAMMASQTQIVEAPHTGLNVRIRAYSDKEWTHVTRPTGGLGGQGSLPVSSRSNNPNGPVGNHGLSTSGGVGMGAGSYGSSEEVDNVAAALMGGGGSSGGWSPGGTGRSAPNGSSGRKTSGGTGSVSAPGPGRVGWAESLLRAIGAPVNRQNKAAVVVWETAEGGGFGNQAANNPLNLNPGPGANWPGHNASGAWAFPTAVDGLRETANYLHMSNFAGINAALQSGKSEHAVLQAIVNSPWASSHYAGNGEMQSGLRNTANGRVWGLAAGTNYAPPGMAWMGERGPELRWNTGGEHVSTAQQSHDMIQATKRPAETMHQAHQPNGLNSTGGGGHTIKVDLHFGKGSVCINSETGDTRHIAEDFAKHVQQVIAEDHTFLSVASGRNHG